MASNIKFSAALRTARASAISTSAGTSALIEIYDGAQPAGPDAAITSQVLLCTLTGNATSFGAAAGGVLTLGAITQGTGTAAATTSGKRATWARIKTSGGAAHIDCTVGTNGTLNTDGTASAGAVYDININNNLITTSQIVSISSFSLTEANA